MPDGTAPAQRLWRLLEPLHAVTYFSPEPVAALRDAGYRGYWMGYFAGRAAPLGAVGPELVRAIFYNFSAGRVEGALPAAWTYAPPPAALAARRDGSGAALRRLLTGAPEVDRAAKLAMQAAAAAPVEGRPLFAANLALPVPDEPVDRLWHATTLLREHRGDGHLSVLLALGVGGRESHVLVSVARDLPRDTYRTARDFDDDEWQQCLDGLRDRGLVTAEGTLTTSGAEFVAEIDRRTDALAAPAFAALGTDGVAELERLLQPLAAAVVRSGELPLDAPQGLDLRTVTPSR